MNIDYYFSLAVNFLYTNKIVALIILVVLILFIWKKPGEAFKFGIFVGVMAVIFYFISLMGGTMTDGSGDKKHMSTKSEQALE